MELVGDRATVAVHDIDSRADWKLKYDVRVPVVEFDRQALCEYRLDKDAVNRALARLADDE